MHAKNVGGNVATCVSCEQNGAVLRGGNFNGSCPDKLCHALHKSYGSGMYSVPDLVLDASEILDVPHSDLSGRVRLAREAGLVSQKFHGRGGASAVPRDGGVVILAPFVSTQPRNVADGIRRYGGLKLEVAIGPNGGRAAPFDLRSKETTLLDALATCLERCSPQSGYMPASLCIALSDTRPLASIGVLTPDNEVVYLSFGDFPKSKDAHSPYSISVHVRAETLRDFVEIFATKADRPARRPTKDYHSDETGSAWCVGMEDDNAGHGWGPWPAHVKRSVNRGSTRKT
jgi:hypothetical protein